MKQGGRALFGIARRLTDASFPDFKQPF